LLQFNSSGAVEVVYGIDRESFRAVSGGFVFIQGHDMEGPDDLLVDDWAAKAKKIKVGDTYNLLNHDWHVAAIIEHGKGARLFVPLATLQDLVGAHDKASIFLLRCTRPEHTEDVIQELRHVVPGYTIRPLKDFLSLMTATNVPGLKTFIHAMIGLAVAIGLLVIFLTMYTTVIERTRDIGVLKSLGADRSFIIRALLSESTALCIMGIAAGVGLAYVVRAAFLAGFPTLSPRRGSYAPPASPWPAPSSAPVTQPGSPAAKTPSKPSPTTDAPPRSQPRGGLPHPRFSGFSCRGGWGFFPVVDFEVSPRKLSPHN
jgi:putative ABC transport system permease protein